MKKVLYAIALVVLVLVISYFAYGIYLNVTLVERYQDPAKTFGLHRTGDGPFPVFTYVYSWKDSKNIDDWVLPKESAFFFVRKFFFNEQRILCLEGSDRPIILKESRYSPQWFSMRGVQYSLPQDGHGQSIMSESDRKYWRQYRDNLLSQGVNNKKARLVIGNTCENLRESNIVTTYSITIFP